MTNTWHNLIQIFIIVNVGNVFTENANYKINPINWRLVEALAEEHPYVVALLNISTEYLCTGTVISERTVLTAGSCIVPELYYIGAKSAVIGKNIDKNFLFEIAKTILHADYTFELISTDPNVMKMHSNLGLVFTVLPTLEVFMPSADIGNYYATELREKSLKTIGYGRVGAVDMVVLQFQDYRQSPCLNPKWYYCVCGYEYSKYSKMYEGEFGKGAPVFLGPELVAVSATPSGMLESKLLEAKYNIFTVLGPYLKWIEKMNSNLTNKIVFRSSNGAQKSFISRACALLTVVKILW